MIRHIRVEGGYAADLPCLRDRTYVFTKGINVLFGPNGCGKSTLLEIMGAYCACNYGWSEYPKPYMLMPDTSNNKGFILPEQLRQMSPGKCNADVGWDGTATFRSCPSVDGSVGFTNQEINTLHLTKPSYGQRRVAALGKLCDLYMNPPDLRDMPNNMNSLWREYWETFAAYIRSLSLTGPPTILLEEPDRFLDATGQIILWKKMIPAFALKCQVIASSNNPLVLHCQNVNVIDMKTGYVEECRAAIRGFYEQPTVSREVGCQADSTPPLP